MKKFYFFLVIIGLLVYSPGSFAQCALTISNFPYSENFEAGQGGWTSAGSYNDWACGAPQKSVITYAGSGSKCWVTGGLTGSFYNYNEASWVESPCFDFTNLQHPFIAFYVWWESEKTYDGTNLQYSLNGGTTWTNVGAYGDPVNCMDDNWYNENSVSYLSTLATPKQGWGGNIQSTVGNCQGGGGSNGWKLATHCMSYLAGQSSVVFRFTFGAGYSCNSFDGIAFDSVSISEAPANVANFTYNCINSNTVSFTGAATPCPDTLLWNFGDPASGANNTSTSLNPNHIFSGPGSYIVTLSASGPCNAAGTSSQTIDILNVSLTPLSAACSAQSGSISTTVTGGNGNYSYSWSNGAITQNLSGLSAGTYTVTISNSISCSVTASATITQSSSLSITPTTAGSGCGTNTGSINLSIGGGSGTYSYSWSTGATIQNISSLAAGNYSVTVTDQNTSCTASALITVNQTGVAPNVSVSSPGILSCTLTSITLTASSTTNGVTYQWSTGAGTANTTVSSPGTYTVTVTNPLTNCTISDSVSVTQNSTVPNVSISPADSLTCLVINVTLSASSTTNGVTYLWSNGSATPTTGVNAPGNYTVTVTDPATSCTSTASVVVNQDVDVPNVSIGNPETLSCTVTSVALTATSSTHGISYVWNNGNTTSTTSVTSPGTYNVTVTEIGDGCTATASVVVNSTSTLSLSATSVATTCGSSDGSATVTIGAGAPPYLYVWNNGGTTPTINNLSGGNYIVTVVDANGCSAIASIAVSGSAIVLLSDSVVNTRCGLSNGLIVINPSAGLSPYTFLWSDGSGGQADSNLAPGNYSVTVTDHGGCSSLLSVSVSPSVPAVVNISANQTTMCSGDSAYICAPVGYTSYSWNTGETTPCIYAKQAGNYYVSTVDSFGCPAQSNHLPITILPSPPVSISVNGDTLKAFNSPTYQWYFNGVPIAGATDSVYVATQAGNYQVMVSNSYGCLTLSNPTNVAGINFLNAAANIKIYPNPLSSGAWQLDVTPEFLGSEVEIFDAGGQLVYVTKIRSQKSELAPAVASGVYILHIYSSTGNIVKKLVKL